jgi:ABC-type multidrug transport system fused ATPase/permease subunit
MRRLPLPDPGVADHRSAGRFLWWLLLQQWRGMIGAIVTGIVAMLTQAVTPAIIGLAIDRGVTAKDTGQLVLLCAVMFLVGVVGSVAGIVRHRFNVSNWLDAAYRVVQLVTRQAVHLGATLPKRVATGEVVAIGNNDLSHLGNAMEITGRAAGAVVSFVVVALLLLHTSVTLGLVVLLGVPLLVLGLTPMLKPLQRRALRHREMTGELSNSASDIVAGLRVLRGIGGEGVFHARYSAESQGVREAGVQVGRLQSLLDAAQVGLPGIFVVLVVWLGARFAVEGKISVGELVAFYGYAAFLMMPLRTATEAVNKWIRAFVSAGRVCRVLSLRPELGDPREPADAPPAGSDLVDVESGLRVRAGRLTALVSERPEETAALADRLGRYLPGDVRWGEVPLERLPRDVVRRRIVVSDANSTLFSGDLAAQLDLRGHGPDAVMAALHAASAEDVLQALPDGLHARVAERGRSFSGGQRQRLVLARVLAADPEVLVLVEPTSAVDAHTEARVADGMRALRVGRTTVVTTTSPLLLDRADEVAFLEDGRVVAVGTHADLLRDVPGYRYVVAREEGVYR